MATVHTVLILSVLFLAVARCDEDGSAEIRSNAGLSVPGSSYHGGESFVYANYEFIFFTKRKVEWNEAKNLCHKLVPGGYLAELNNRKVEKFAGYLVSENKHLLKNSSMLWIGGRYGGTSWKWVKSGLSIPCKASADAYPPWSNVRSFFDNECLTFMKSTSSCIQCSIFFVPEECHEKHGFLCVKVLKGSVPKKQPSKIEKSANTSVKATGPDDEDILVIEEPLEGQTLADGNKYEIEESLKDPTLAEKVLQQNGNNYEAKRSTPLTSSKTENGTGSSEKSNHHQDGKKDDAKRSPPEKQAKASKVGKRSASSEDTSKEDGRDLKDIDKHKRNTTSHNN